MRIVVSGSAGTGKTTLVNRIAEAASLSVIPDFADSVLRESGYKSFKNVENPEVMRQIRLEALYRKVDAESKVKDFVSDKSVVDYFAYWLNVAMHEASQEQNGIFLEKTSTHAKKTYDLVIIPPFGRFNIEDNQIRTTNPHYQFRNQVTIKGLYAEFGIKWVEYAMNLEDSLEKIIKDLGIK